MPKRNTSSSYGSVAKTFHWTIFILVTIMLVYGFLLGYVPKEYAGIAFNTHKLIGLLILVLMVLRFLWALTNPKPILPHAPFWQKVAERVVHYSLYLAIFAMPLSGWIGSSAAGRAPHLGSLTFSFPVQQNKAIVETAFQIHGYLAYIIIFLVSIHIFAALYHHFIRKDDVLTRMLPSSSRG